MIVSYYLFTVGVRKVILGQTDTESKWFSDMYNGELIKKSCV